MNFYDNIKLFVSPYIPKLLIAFILVIMFLTIAIYTRDSISNIGNSILIHQVKSIVYYSILCIGFFTILIQFGVETTTVLTFLGATFLSVALAFQTFLSNIVASFYILFSGSFNIGNKIKSGAYVEGTVIYYDLFNTTVITATNDTITVPNNYFLNNPIKTTN
jgi:small conductance mechanosensitive channel